MKYINQNNDFSHEILFYKNVKDMNEDILTLCMKFMDFDSGNLKPTKDSYVEFCNKWLVISQVIDRLEYIQEHPNYYVFLIYDTGIRCVTADLYRADKTISQDIEFLRNEQDFIMEFRIDALHSSLQPILDNTFFDVFAETTGIKGEIPLLWGFEIVTD